MILVVRQFKHHWMKEFSCKGYKNDNDITKILDKSEEFGILPYGKRLIDNLHEELR